MDLENGSLLLGHLSLAFLSQAMKLLRKELRWDLGCQRQVKLSDCSGY